MTHARASSIMSSDGSVTPPGCRPNLPPPARVSACCRSVLLGFLGQSCVVSLGGRKYNSWLSMDREWYIGSGGVTCLEVGADGVAEDGAHHGSEGGGFDVSHTLLSHTSNINHPFHLHARMQISLSGSHARESESRVTHRSRSGGRSHESATERRRESGRGAEPERGRYAGSCGDDWLGSQYLELLQDEAHMNLWSSSSTWVAADMFRHMNVGGGRRPRYFSNMSQGKYLASEDICVQELTIRSQDNISLVRVRA